MVEARVAAKATSAIDMRARQNAETPGQPRKRRAQAPWKGSRDACRDPSEC